MKQEKMKLETIVSLILCIVGTLGLGGCTSNETEPTPPPSEDFERFSTFDYAGDSFANSGSKGSTNDAMLVINRNKNLNEANKSLAFKLLDLIYSDDENFTASPLSLAIAMSMLGEGASAESLDEIHSFLTSGLVKGNDFVRTMQSLSKALNYAEDREEVRAANSLWVNNHFPILGSYVNDVMKNYSAGIYTADLQDISSKAMINEWCSKNTNGKISNILDDAPGGELAILNALFLACKWHSPFSAELTALKPFRNCDGEEVSIPMMKKDEMELQYAGTSSFERVTLETTGLFELRLFIPKKNVKQSKEKELEALKEIYAAKTKKTIVNLELPKFDIYSANELTDCLKEALPTIFDRDKANFNRIYDKDSFGLNLFVKKIKQDNALTVDEEGFSGAAVTIIDMDATDYIDDEELKTVDLKIDRPFYFCVKHAYSDVAFFFGKINRLSR